MNSVFASRTRAIPFQHWAPLSVLSGGIFLIDLVFPLGVAAGVLYIAVILSSLRYRDSQLLLWAATSCSILTILALFISPVGGEFWKVLVNRGLALFAIWTTTLMSRTQLQQTKIIQHNFSLTDRVFKASNDHISILGRDYRYRQVNPKYERAHGISSQELVGMSVSKLLGKEVFEETVKPKLDQCLQGEEVHYEAWFRFGNNQDHYMAVSYLPLTSENKDIEEIVVIARDWTERKRIEEALQDNQQKLRTILDAMTNFVGIGSVDGIVMDCNQAPLSMAGLTREDVIGKNFIDTYWLSYSPKIQEKVRDTIKRVSQGETVREDYLARMGEDLYITVDACYVPVKDKNGQVVKIVHSGIDVTHRRSAEKALKESVDQFRDLYESAPLAYFSASFDGFITRVNNRTSELLGYSQHELIGKHELTLYPPTKDGNEKASTIQQRTQQGISIQDEELEMAKKDGSIFWVSLTVRLIFDESGKIIERRGMVQDISDRKRVEDELRASEYRFRSLVETAGSIIIGLTPDGWIVEWNREAERLYGKTREETLDQNYFDEFIQEIDRPHIVADIKKVLGGKPSRDFQSVVIDNTGNKKQVLWNVDRLLNEYKQPYGVICIGRDVTEWEQAKETLQRQALMFNTLYDGVLITDPQGSITDWNAGAEEVFGYSRVEALGRTPAFLHQPSESTTLTQHIINELTQKGRWQGEINFLKKDGTAGICETIVTPLPDLNGHPIGTIGVNRDITEKKSAEDRLRKSEERFRTFFEAGLVGMGMISLELKWLEVNDQLCKLLGYSQKELKQTTWAELTYPDDLALDQANFENMRVGTLNSYATSKRYIRKDGSLMYANLYVNAVRNASDQVEYFTTMIEDVTEQKHGEALLMKWAMIFQHTQWGVAVSAGTSIIFEMVNEAYARMHGYAIRELEGMSIADIVTPEFRIQLPSTIEKIHQDGFLSYEARHMRKDGSTFPVLVTESAIKDINGQTLYRVTNVIDISQLKSVEDALKSSEERLSIALEATSSGTWDWNVLTGDVIFGKEWLKSLGYEPQDLPMTVESWENLVHPDDFPKTLQAINKHFSGETQIYESINRLRMKNGEWRWNLDRGRVMEWTTDGKPLRMVGTDTDITARKEAEEALRTIELRYRNYFQSGLVGMAITSIEKNWLEVNDRLCVILGYSREELTRKTWVDLTYPDDLLPDETEFNKLLAGTQDSYSMEKRFLKKDGSLIFSNLYAHAIRKPSGAIDYFTAMIEDITDRKQAQKEIARLAAIVETSGDAIIGKDLEGRITYWNQSAECIFGYRAKEIIGQDKRILLPPDRPTEVSDILTRIKSGEIIHNYETTRRCKNGELIDVALSVSPVRGPTGKLMGAATIARNITERKQSEVALEESRNRFRAIFDDAGIGMALVDIKGYPVETNRSFQTLLGFTAEELRAMSFVEFTHAEDVNLDWNLYEELKAGTRDSFNLDKRYIRKDGQIVWTHLTVTSLRDAQGQLKFSIGMIENITEKKQSEALLTKWATIFQHTQWGVAVGNADSHNLDLVNEAYARMHGYTVQELQGQPIAHVFAPAFRIQLPAFIQKIHEEGFQSIESLHIRKDGTTFPALLTVSAIKDSQRVVQYRVANLIDISDRKMAEEALKQSERLANSTMNALTEQLCVLDESGQILSTNERWDEFARHNHGDLKKLGIGANYLTVCAHACKRGDKEAELFLNGLQAVLTKQQKDFFMEYQCSSPRNFRWYSGRVTRFPDPGPIRVVVSHTDITDQKLLEETIRKHNEDLELTVEQRTQRIQELEQRRMQVEKLAALSQIAAGVAHEINNPLASISQSLVLLKRAIPTQHPHFGYMGKVEDCIDRIAIITKRLYQLYRPSSPTPRPIDIRTCIQTAAEIMEERALKNGIEIKIPYLFSTLMIQVSQGELIQVLCNLLNNAIDASPNEGIIEMSLTTGPKTLTLFVTDQGEGISSEAAPHIFEPFFTTKQSHIDGGMGLGLSISHSLVESMGGSLDFSSSLMQGSTFTITLPLT